jgi:hypothetical protein
MPVIGLLQSTPKLLLHGWQVSGLFSFRGYGDVDLAVFKNFKVNEQFTVQFRSEIFNLFNRVNLAPPFPTGFAGPNAQNGFGVSADPIGDYNGAPGIGPGEPFNVQFALKLVF